MVNDEAKSLLYWITKNSIKNEVGQPIEFKQHRFLLDIYADRTPIQVIRKASQVGASTMEILRVLHDAIFLGINQIYTLQDRKFNITSYLAQTFQVFENFKLMAEVRQELDKLKNPITLAPMIGS